MLPTDCNCWFWNYCSNSSPRRDLQCLPEPLINLASGTGTPTSIFTLNRHTCQCRCWQVRGMSLVLKRLNWTLSYSSTITSNIRFESFPPDTSSDGPSEVDRLWSYDGSHTFAIQGSCWHRTCLGCCWNLGGRHGWVLMELFEKPMEYHAPSGYSGDGWARFTIISPKELEPDWSL